MSEFKPSQFYQKWINEAGIERYKCKFMLSSGICPYDTNNRGNIFNHVKKHFPELKKKLNDKVRQQKSYIALLDKCRSNSLSSKLESAEKINNGSISDVDDEEIQAVTVDHDLMMTTAFATSGNKKTLYFLILLPPIKTAKLHEEIKELFNSDQDIDDYVGKRANAAIRSCHGPDSSTGKHCLEKNWNQYLVHKIIFQTKKELELAEVFYQTYLFYRRNYNYERKSDPFIVFNQKIEETAAQHHDMPKHVVAYAKKCADKNVPLFCMPGCEVEHNHPPDQPFKLPLHMTMTPEVLMVQSNQPSTSTSKRSFPELTDDSKKTKNAKED